MLTIHRPGGSADAHSVTPKKSLFRVGLVALAIVAFFPAASLAWAQEPAPLPDVPLPSAAPTTDSSTVDGLLDQVPHGPTGVQPPGIGDVTDPLEAILYPPADPEGGSTGPGGGKTKPGPNTTSGSTSLSPGAGPASGGTLTDPASAATRLAPASGGSVEDPWTAGGVAGRALRLAAPMAAPIGIAIAGVLGLVMMAKGNGKLQGLDDEKEALGGWTVIRL